MIAKTTSRLEFASWVMGIISALVAGVTAISSFNYGRDLASPSAAPKISPPLEIEVRQLRQEVTAIKATLSNMQAASASGPPASKDVSRQAQQNAAKLADLGNRLQRLEQAILTTPAKALEIPLMQRDIDAIKQSQLTSNAALKDSVDRVYDQNKWLLGGVSMSILALGKVCKTPSQGAGLA